MLSSLQFWKKSPEPNTGRSRGDTDGSEVSNPASEGSVTFGADRDAHRSAHHQGQQPPSHSLVDEEHKLDSLQVMQAHDDIVRILLIIDKNMLASCGDDGLINIWDIHLGICLHTFRGHTQRIISLVMTSSSDGQVCSKRLVSISADKTLRVWDLDTWCEASVTKLSRAQVGSVRCLLSYREHLLTGGSLLSLWNTDGGLINRRSLIVEGNDIQHLLAVDHSGTHFIVSIADEFIDILEFSETPEDGQHLWHVTQLPKQKAMIRSICQVSDDSFAVGQEDGCVSIVGIPSFLLMVRIPHKLSYGADPRTSSLNSAVIQIEFFSKKLIFYAVGRKVFVYDREHDQVVAELPGQTALVRHFCFYQHLLVTCSEDGVIRLWSLSPFLCPDQPFPLQSAIVKVGECVGHSGSVKTAVSYSDGIVSCGSDNLVIAWRDKLRASVRRREVSHTWNKAYT